MSEQEVDQHNARALRREAVERITVAAEEIGLAAGLADDIDATGHPFPQEFVDALTQAETCLDALLEQATAVQRA